MTRARIGLECHTSHRVPVEKSCDHVQGTLLATDPRMNSSLVTLRFPAFLVLLTVLLGAAPAITRAESAVSPDGGVFVPPPEDAGSDIRVVDDVVVTDVSVADVAQTSDVPAVLVDSSVVVVDSSTVVQDTGNRVDAANVTAPAAGGCSVRSTSSTPGAWLPAVSALVALGFVLDRRRRVA